MRAAPLRRVLVTVTVALSLCAACAANAFAAGGQNPVVVIVPGLQMSVPGMTPTSGGGCGAQGGLASLCQAYTDQGFDVYIPPTSTTGGAGIVINTGGNVADNASALSGYVSNIESQNNGADVSAVGYSMGGLMVVDAVRDDGMAVNSIVTIGSPLDGSYMADDLTGIANAGIPFISSAAQNEINSIGQGAIYSLTSSDRTAENSGQGPVGVPMTTIGGDGCGTSLGDCVVGLSSQFGTNSNLGPTQQGTDPDVHTAGPFGILTMLCGGCSPELNDPNVASAAVKASQSGCSSSSYCIPQAPQVRGALVIARARGLVLHARSKARRNVPLTLNTSSSMSVAAGASQTITGANLIASASPFAAGCAGATAVAPSASTSIYYTSASDLDCASNVVTVDNQGSQAITVAVFSNPGNVLARIGGRGAKQVPIVVTAKTGITAVKIMSRGGDVLRKVNGDGKRVVSFAVPRALASQRVLTATLTSGTGAYTATIPRLPPALVTPTLTVRPKTVKAGHTVTISGTEWAAGNVTLTLLANGSQRYVLTTLSADATAHKGFSVTFTAPSDITARTPVKVTAGEAGRAPAHAKFTIAPSSQHH